MPISLAGGASRASIADQKDVIEQLRRQVSELRSSNEVLVGLVEFCRREHGNLKTSA